MGLAGSNAACKLQPAGSRSRLLSPNSSLNPIRLNLLPNRLSMQRPLSHT